MSTTSSDVTTVSLAVINYEALAARNSEEIKKLLDAGQSRGMFYLDLRGPRTASLFDDVAVFFATGNTFFNLPADSKEKIDAAREGLERGYHANKSLKYYEIARDEFQLGKWTLPPTIEPQKERVNRTLQIMNTVAQTVLAELCAAIDLTIPELNDDPTIPSDTALKLLFKPPVHEVGSVILKRHTDFGLITFLWYDEVTTQVPVYGADGLDSTSPVETDDWAAVPVVEGAILVNIADDLQERSGKRLRSTVHRVVAPPGPKRVKNGLAYFLRPYKN